MANLLKYETSQESKKRVRKTDPSGVACTEKNCKGEMMIVTPFIWQEDLQGRTGLKRAVCGECGWKGWV